MGEYRRRYSWNKSQQVVIGGVISIVSSSVCESLCDLHFVYFIFRVYRLKMYFTNEAVNGNVWSKRAELET